MAPCTVRVQWKETQSSVTISFSLFTFWSCQLNLIRRHTKGFKEYSAFFIFLCKPWLIVPEQQLKLYTPSESRGCDFELLTQTVAHPPQAAGVSASVSEEEPRERAGISARWDPEPEGGEQQAAAAAGPEPAAASRGAHRGQPAARDHPADQREPGKGNRAAGAGRGTHTPGTPLAPYHSSHGSFLQKNCTRVVVFLSVS